MTTATYMVGDVFARMADLPDNSVDLVMTSPPFLALRSYLPADHPDKHLEIGSEPTPAAFLDTLLALTAEWGRLLAPHGSICVELGDTYAGSGGAGGDYDPDGLRAGQAKFGGSGKHERAHLVATGQMSARDKRGTGWPLDKSLTGIPTLYAWSLAYGRNLLTGEPSPAGQWRVRNLVAWVRPNPPVGALGDKFRPATSYLTIACKARDRYFDLDAVRTPVTAAEWGKSGQSSGESYQGGDGGYNHGRERHPNPAGAPPLDWWNHIDQLIDHEIAEQNALRPNGPQGAQPPNPKALAGPNDVRTLPEMGHNRTSGARGSHIRRRLEAAGYLGGPGDDVWDIAPSGYPGAHYAVYPPELCVRPILAMTPRRVCTTCGKPSRRIIEDSPGYAALKADRCPPGTNWTNQDTRHNAKPDGAITADRRTVGWSDCGHGSTWRPGHVLDPFAGTGTTLAVATGHGYEATGIDLDPRNAELAQQRLGMFLTIDHPDKEATA
jgi:DNA modification methylase